MNPAEHPPIPLSSVIIGDRFRKVYGDVDTLADSIEQTGLIQPIVLTKVGDAYHLVAGGRRMCALCAIESVRRENTESYEPVMLHHGTTCDPLHPGYIFSDELSAESRLEAELIENTQRLDYDWRERLRNVLAVYELKVRRNAAEGKSWGYRETGALLGMALGPVSDAIKIARVLREDPDGPVSQCATVREAYCLLLQQAQDKANAELVRRLVPVTQPKAVVEPTLVDGVEVPPPLDDAPVNANDIHIDIGSMLYNRDCLKFMDNSQDAIFDHVITDTPYAIDMDHLDQQNPHGGMNDISRIADTHDVAENLELLAAMMPRVFRVLRPSGFFVTWCDIMQWQYLYDLGTRAGFKVQRWPVTWVKMHQCMNQSAQYNFTKNTEIAIIMRKPGATMAKPAPNCVVMAANSTEDKKLGHPFVKPYEVWDYLLRYIALPGQTIYEPCAGVGSGVLSMLRLGYRVVATEIDEKHYNQLVINVTDHFKSQYPNCKFV